MKEIKKTWKSDKKKEECKGNVVTKEIQPFK